MSDRDIRRLLDADEAVPAERLSLIKERVMNSVMTQEPSTLARGRRLRGPALAGFIVLVAATTAAASAALGLFPKALDDLGCRGPGSVEEMLASVEATDGRTFQFWVTKASADTAPNGDIVLILNPDGSQSGVMIGCNQPGQSYSASDIWARAPGETSVNGTLMYVIGRVPAGAATATVTFNDGGSSNIEVQASGYFLGLVSRPEIRISDDPDLDPWPVGGLDLPEPVHVAAFADDGTLIAEDHTPWGS